METIKIGDVISSELNKSPKYIVSKENEDARVVLIGINSLKNGYEVFDIIEDLFQLAK